MAIQLDNNPNQEVTLQFFDMLLSECEQLQYGLVGQGDGVEKPAGGAVPKVKAVKPMGGKGSPPGSSNNKCRHWGTEAGCKFAKQCRYEHPVLEDASSRCWLCSSTLHRKNECPHKSSQSTGSSTGGSDGLGEKGGKSGGGKSSSKSKDTSSGKSSGGKSEDSAAMSRASTSRITGGGQDPGEKEKCEQPAVRSTAAEVQPTQHQQQSQGDVTEGLMTEVTSLLKSLRMSPPQLRAYQVNKMSGGESQRTLLDGGATHCLRAARDGREWMEGAPVNVQLAAGSADMRINAITKTLLVAAGGEPIQQIIPLHKLTDIGYEINWSKAGCSIRHGVHGLLDIKMEQGCPTVNVTTGTELMQQIEELEASKVALRRVALGQRSAETPEQKAIVDLKKPFPEVPLRLLERIPGKHDWSGHELPFNRRRRRQIEQVKNLVIHLFAGREDPCWKKEEGNGTVVVCLDVLGGCDLLNNQHLAGWLEDLAKRGKVNCWLSGPPCRTTSMLRNKQDGGPPQLRGRGDDRFGLESLRADQWTLVDGDSVLWLRSLWWMYLGWTHGAAAEHLIEQPRDPQEWSPSDQWPVGGCPSFMTWKETQTISSALGLSMVRLDQGALGHPTPKPTMLATDMVEVIKLDGLRADSYDPLAWNLPLQQRLQKSKELASWAPGLKNLLCGVIRRIHRGEPAVRALSLKERQEIQAWQDHHRAGHLPHRKDCPTCLLAAGRDRQHRRQACPTSYTLSFDILGPFCPGQDQQGNGFRYGLIGVYTVPVDGSGAPLPEGLAELRVQTGAREVQGDVEGEEVMLEAGEQHEEVLQEEPEEHEDIPEAVIQQQEVLERKWKEFIKDRRAVPVKNITFGAPIRSREASDVLSGVSKIYARARAMQLPITRVHTGIFRWEVSKMDSR